MCGISRTGVRHHCLPPSLTRAWLPLGPPLVPLPHRRQAVLPRANDGRSRRRRAIDPNQLALVLDGAADCAYAYSFIVTNLCWHATALEWWFRQRALIEERIKDAKLGAALRHLPSGYQAVNRTWMWAALMALNISAWLQSLARTDTTGGRAHGKRLRRELICLVARVLHRARQVVLRFTPGMRKGPFQRAWNNLRALPTYTPAVASG